MSLAELFWFGMFSLDVAIPPEEPDYQVIVEGAFINPEEASERSSDTVDFVINPSNGVFVIQKFVSMTMVYPLSGRHFLPLSGQWSKVFHQQPRLLWGARENLLAREQVEEDLSAEFSRHLENRNAGRQTRVAEDLVSIHEIQRIVSLLRDQLACDGLEGEVSFLGVFSLG